MVEENQNPSAADDIVRANADREVTQSASFASYYTNDIQVQTSPWDVRLTVNKIQGVDKEQRRAFIEALADVSMSPQLAKKLVAILREQLEGYESKFGTIPQPGD